MHHLRVALGFLSCTRLQHWPGVISYYLGWLLFRVTGLRLFRSRQVHLEDIIVVVDVEGRGGLVFLYEILVQRIYDFPLLLAAKDIHIIFDAGANCGFYSILATRRWPQVRCVGFEPHPVTFQHLQQNIRANHLEDSVTPVQAAVSSAAGHCTLQVSSDSSMGRVVTSESVSGNTVQVPMISLDDYARAHSLYPDLLKIDVEGFEVEVLKGARSCLDHARYVVLEIHSEELAKASLELLHQAKFSTVRQDALILATK